MKEILLQKLKNKALQLDRNLKRQEILSIINEDEVKQYFKNISQISRILPYSFTKEELINILKNKTQKSGRVPNNIEMNFPQAIVFSNIFGSWDNALNEANLIFKEVSNDYLFNLIVETYKKLPIDSSFSKKYIKTILDQSTYKLICHRFGSWERALAKAGIKRKIVKKIKSQNLYIKRRIIDVKHKNKRKNENLLPNDIIFNEIINKVGDNKDKINIVLLIRLKSELQRIGGTNVINFRLLRNRYYAPSDTFYYSRFKKNWIQLLDLIENIDI